MVVVFNDRGAVFCGWVGGWVGVVGMVVVFSHRGVGVWVCGCVWVCNIANGGLCPRVSQGVRRRKHTHSLVSHHEDSKPSLPHPPPPQNSPPQTHHHHHRHYQDSNPPNLITVIIYLSGLRTVYVESNPASHLDTPVAQFVTEDGNLQVGGWVGGWREMYV